MGEEAGVEGGHCLSLIQPDTRGLAGRRLLQMDAGTLSPVIQAASPGRTRRLGHPAGSTTRERLTQGMWKRRRQKEEAGSSLVLPQL